MKNYNKLVRDKIPYLLNIKGLEPIIKKVEGVEYENYLYLKLIEELMEFINNPSEEEFVDIMEVMDSFKKHFDLFEANLQETKEAKKKEKGGFDERYVLLEVNDLN